MLTTKDLQDLNKTRFIVLKAVCKSAGLSYDSILGKLKRNSELKTTESQALSKALSILKPFINNL